MKKRNKRNYSLVRQDNTIIITFPVLGVFILISVVLIILGAFIRKTEEYPKGHIFAFLNWLIQKANETGDLMLGLGVALLIISVLGAIIAFFINGSKSNYDRL